MLNALAQRVSLEEAALIERESAKGRSVMPFLFFKTRAAAMVTTGTRSCHGRAGPGGHWGGGSALQQTERARGRWQANWL